MGLKREIWNGKFVYVMRDEKQRIISWTKVKGSGLSLAQAKEVLRENKTLVKSKKTKQRITITSSNLTNFREVVSTVASNADNRKKGVLIRAPREGVRQYIVTGIYRGKPIAGRSSQLGSPLAPSPRKAKDQAWHNFLALIGQVEGAYDADEGIKHLSRVTNIKEGWVRYAKIIKN